MVAILAGNPDCGRTGQAGRFAIWVRPHHWDRTDGRGRAVSGEHAWLPASHRARFLAADSDRRRSADALEPALHSGEGSGWRCAGGAAEFTCDLRRGAT